MQLVAALCNSALELVATLCNSALELVVALCKVIRARYDAVQQRAGARCGIVQRC
jgi:hypothetical protein